MDSLQKLPSAAAEHWQLLKHGQSFLVITATFEVVKSFSLTHAQLPAVLTPFTARLSFAWCVECRSTLNPGCLITALN